jgi:molecular chaperone HtpG
VDCADLPLNVSRELIQEHPDLRSMKGALTRRVLDMLAKLAQNGDYADFWAQFGGVIKEGVVEDPANRERILKLLRFATTADDSGKQSRSLDDYLASMVDGQDRIYYLLADKTTTAAASPHIEQLRRRGIEVLLLTDPIDPWIAGHLTEYEGKTLADVGRAKLDLPDDAGELGRATDDEHHKSLLKKLRRVLKERVDTVNLSRRLVDSPACVVSAEHELNPQLRRMLEATGRAVPAARPILEINAVHPLVVMLAAEPDDSRFRELAHVLVDHALLADGSPLDNPADYVRRVNRLLLESTGPASA